MISEHRKSEPLKVCHNIPTAYKAHQVTARKWKYITVKEPLSRNRISQPVINDDPPDGVLALNRPASKEIDGDPVTSESPL